MIKHRTIFISLIIIVILLPILAHARGLVPCGGPTEQPCTFCDIFRMLQNIINYIWWILLIIAPLFIIAGGIMILTAGVKPDQLDHGKRIITGTVVGLAIAFLSWTILNVVFNTLVDEGSEGFPWPWNEIQCEGGGVREEGTWETSQNRYCHLQIRNAPDQMVQDYTTTSACYASCASRCTSLGSTCEASCCLEQNYDGNNNVCNIVAMDNWCIRSAPSGSNVWVLNPPPGGALPEQRGDASTTLTRLLNCMYGEIPTLTINSISDNALCTVPPSCNPATRQGCVHSLGSCHYGGPVTGPCYGFSYAVDFHTNVSCQAIMDSAQRCQTEAGGTVFVLWENDHTHVSINGRGCQCSESGVSTCSGH